jgi:hypothetical protein
VLINLLGKCRLVTIKVQVKLSLCAIKKHSLKRDRLCGLVVRVIGYRSGGPGSIPGTTRKKK